MDFQKTGATFLVSIACMAAGYAQEAEVSPLDAARQEYRNLTAEFDNLSTNKTIIAEIEVAACKDAHCQALMEKKRELDSKRRELSSKRRSHAFDADANPEVAALKKSAEDARAAYLAKREELLAGDKDIGEIQQQMDTLSKERDVLVGQIDAARTELHPTLKDLKTRLAALAIRIAVLEEEEAARKGKGKQ